jgi:hypothetical protein
MVDQAPTEEEQNRKEQAHEYRLWKMNQHQNKPRGLNK